MSNRSIRRKWAELRTRLGLAPHGWRYDRGMRTLFVWIAFALAWPLPAQDPTERQPADPGLRELTAALGKAETVDDAAVGDGGEKSETYRIYERWRSRATVHELRRLTRDASAVVRAYAVKALVDTEAEVDWPAIVTERLLDTAEVTTFEGCCRARQFTGDVVFTLVRPHLTAEQVLDAAEALITKKSPLYAREWALRTLRLRDGMLHTVRELASNGDTPAAIALARYGLPVDVPILTRLLQADSPFDDNASFLAAGMHRDPRLLAPLLAIEGKARRRLEADNPSRLRFWLQAIAAQRSADAAGFLSRFLAAVEPGTGFREKDWLETYELVLAPHADCPAFDAVRAALHQRGGAPRQTK